MPAAKRGGAVKVRTKTKVLANGTVLRVTVVRSKPKKARKTNGTK
jgi:hypothetical protein